MTAPRAREQADPPSPPDRRPPRRGGGSSPSTHAASAAGRAAGPARSAGARRSLVRSAHALAVAALLALSGALALPATAQEQTTFVSNLAKAQGSSSGTIQAQSFSTGSHTAGYMLSTVRLLYATKGSAADTSALRVKIRTNSSGAPGGLVADLSSPASFAVDTIVSFTAPANTKLDAEETYWVVINEGYDSSSTERLAFYQTTSDDETTTTADSNWSIGDERLWRNDSSHDWATSSNSLKIAIIGTAASGTPPAAPTGFSATAGNRSVALAWNAPASDADITRHEYRYKTDGSYPDTWKKIPYSATGDFNADGFTVTNLDNDTAHTFQLHAVNDEGVSAAVESSAATPSGSGDVIVSITMRRYDGQDGEPYGVGDEIVFVVEFSRNVANTTNPGNEKVRFDIGSTRKDADYYSGGVGKKLWYKYTIGEGDVDSDGIEIPAGPTALPETYFYSSSNDDEFDESGIKAQGPFPDRKVDGVYPTLDSAAVNGTALVLTWDETLRDDSGPAAGDFAVTVAGSSRSVSGVAVAGSAVTLTLASAVTAGQTVTVSYTKGTNPLKDLASNDAPGLTDQAVTNNTAPTNFAARVGNAQVVLSWDAPDSASGVTRHEYQYKEGTGAYQGWVQIANSGVDGANEAGFTVTGLTNEVLHTFQLRAVNSDGDESAAAEADPVTPTPGICDRTQIVYEIIVDHLSDRDDCAAVTVANLAGITTLQMDNQNIATMKEGDLGGLRELTYLSLVGNTFTTLPALVFGDLVSLETLLLSGGELTSLPANVLSPLGRRLLRLDLHENELTSLPRFPRSLTTLRLNDNNLSSLRPAAFSRMTALQSLFLSNNDLSSLPAGLFSSLTALVGLNLSGNDLTRLPSGLFSGLTALDTLVLDDNPAAGDTLPLTVTVEKVGTDQVRARVLAGAPTAVDIPVTLANGSLAGGATALSVAAGSVAGTELAVTRTVGTVAAVTVDVDLSTQPSVPFGHTGYVFARAASGLPAAILPGEGAPENFTAAPDDSQVVLSWDAPATDSGVTRHEYRQKTTGSYGDWTQIPDSGVGGDNEDGYTVTGLTNETVYTFELHSVVGTTNGEPSEAGPVTPTPGICDRTQQVRNEILKRLTGVSDCAAVNVADLARVGVLYPDGITALKLGDFAGLTGVTTIVLSYNELGTLPANLFSGLTSLGALWLDGTELTSLRADTFSGLTALTYLTLDDNASLGTLPANLFSGLTRLESLRLGGIGMTEIPAGLFSDLSALTGLYLSSNGLTTLPAGVFSGLTGLSTLDLRGNTVDPMPLTVTLEKVGADQVRAKVLAGAPFAVDIPVTPANGTLAGDVTVLTVAAGSVESAAVAVTRTDGTTEAVTVDVDLSTQPSRPSLHSGYEFVRALSGLPAEILPSDLPDATLSALSLGTGVLDRSGLWILLAPGWCSTSPSPRARTSTRRRWGTPRTTCRCWRRRAMATPRSNTWTRPTLRSRTRTTWTCRWARTTSSR